MTIGLVKSSFRVVVNDDHESILHRYRYTGLQKFWSYEFDLLGLRDVIGHVTIGLGIRGFLLAVHINHASILHCYGDMGPQRYWGHDLNLDSRQVYYVYYYALSFTPSVCVTVSL